METKTSAALPATPGTSLLNPSTYAITPSPNLSPGEGVPGPPGFFPEESKSGSSNLSRFATLRNIPINTGIPIANTTEINKAKLELELNILVKKLVSPPAADGDCAKEVNGTKRLPNKPNKPTPMVSIGGLNIRGIKIGGRPGSGVAVGVTVGLEVALALALGLGLALGL